MSRESLANAIKFRIGPLKEAATHGNTGNLGRIDGSELGRKGRRQCFGER